MAAILDADNHQSSEPAELRRARRQAHEARKKRDQYLAALDAGLDPVLVTERTRVAQVELASATAVIDADQGSGPGLLSGQEVRYLLEGVGGLTTLLAHSDTAERQRVYRVLLVCVFAISAARRAKRSSRRYVWGCRVSEGGCECS